MSAHYAYLHAWLQAAPALTETQHGAQCEGDTISALGLAQAEEQMARIIEQAALEDGAASESDISESSSEQGDMAVAGKGNVNKVNSLPHHDLTPSSCSMAQFVGHVGV